jgi:hypothetical protein
VGYLGEPVNNHPYGIMRFLCMRLCGNPTMKSILI